MIHPVTSSKTRVRLGQSMLDNTFLVVKNEDKVTSSTTQVRLGQSMLDNFFFNSSLFSDVNGVNCKTSSTTQVRLGQSMLDNIFFFAEKKH